MLRKMVIQGLVAAALIAGAAAVYAQATDNGYLTAPGGKVSDGVARDGHKDVGKDEHRGKAAGRDEARSETHSKGHDRHVEHD